MEKLLAAILALVLYAAPAPQTRAEEPVLFVAVGFGGRRIASHDGNVWIGDQRWSDVAKDHDEVLCDIAYGADRFVAVGGGAGRGRLLSTSDGKTWRELPGMNERIATIRYGNARFVAACGRELLVSTDGEDFRRGGKLEWKGNIHPRRSACGDTEAGYRFVVIGDIDLEAEGRGVPWRAATGDGTRWDHAALETPAVRDIAYGSGHFVVVGPDGLIESSHDGQTWEKRSSAPGENFTRVVWTGARFLVSGGSTMWSSADGLAWKKEAAAVPGDLAWAREKFLGIGFPWEGGVCVSSDLIQWRKVTMPAGPGLLAVACGPVENAAKR